MYHNFYPNNTIFFLSKTMCQIFRFFLNVIYVEILKAKGGVQNLEWSNLELPIFRIFKITNIKIVKDELFNYFIYEFIFTFSSHAEYVKRESIVYYYFSKLFERSKYLIIYSNYKSFYIVKFRKLYHFPNKKITNFLNFTIEF